MYNVAWQKARSQRPLQSLYFSGGSEKQGDFLGLWLVETFSTSLLSGIQRKLTGSKISMSSTKFMFFEMIGKHHGLVSDWLRLSTSFLNGIEPNLTGSKISTSSTKFVFLDRSKKQYGRPGLCFTGVFSTYSLQLLNGIQWNLTGSEISTSCTKFVFFGPIEKKTKVAALASKWLRHFRLLFWVEFNEIWQEARSQRHLQSLSFSGWSKKKTKMAALSSDWKTRLPPRLLIGRGIFDFSFWNCWMEFNETWHEARFQRSLPSLCFWADRKNKIADQASDCSRHFQLPFFQILFWWTCWYKLNSVSSSISTRQNILYLLHAI